MTEKDESAKPVWTPWMEKQVREHSGESSVGRVRIIEPMARHILGLPEFQGIDLDELKRKARELGIDVDALTSAERLELEQEQKRIFHREILGWALILGLAVLIIIGLESLTSSSSGSGSGGTCRAQLERCLENQPESRWESVCQPSYYRCLNR